MNSNRRGHYLEGFFTSGNASSRKVNSLENKDAVYKNQMERLKEQIQKNKQGSEEYRKNVQELIKVNKLLTDSYNHNLNLIVDLSTLLNGYQNFVEEIANAMENMDTVNVSQLPNLDHLSYLTSDKFTSVASDFEKQRQKMKDAGDKFGYNLDDLQNAQEKLQLLASNNTQTSVRNLTQKGGGKRKGKYHSRKTAM